MKRVEPTGLVPVERDRLPATLARSGADWALCDAPLEVSEAFFAAVQWFYSEDVRGVETYAVLAVGRPTPDRTRPWALVPITAELVAYLKERGAARSKNLVTGMILDAYPDPDPEQMN